MTEAHCVPEPSATVRVNLWWRFRTNAGTRNRRRLYDHRHKGMNHFSRYKRKRDESMNIVGAFANALRERRRPSPVSRVTTIVDVNRYLQRSGKKIGGPAVVCHLRPCFTFARRSSRVRRVVLVFYLEGTLLSAELCLRSSHDVATPKQRIFLGDLNDPECLPQLGDALRSTIGLDVPFFSR